jgi:hypothetical protein
MNKIQTFTKENTTNINKHTQRCTHEPVAYTNWKSNLKIKSNQIKKNEKEPNKRKLILFIHNCKQIENSNISKNTNRSNNLTLQNNKPTKQCFMTKIK